MTLGEKGCEGLLAIGNGGVFVFKSGESPLGRFLVAEDLAETVDEFVELRVFLIEEACAEAEPVGGRSEVALTVESEEDAIEEGLLNRGVVGGCELGEEEGEGFFAIHLDDFFEARLIEVNEGNRFGRSGDEGDVAVRAFAVGFPLFRECFWIESSGVDKEAMTDGFRLAFWDLPVSENGAARSDSELPIDAPRLGEVGVFWMIKDGNVAPVVAAFNVHSNVNPDCAFAFGLVVCLESGVDDFSFCFAAMPRHAKEESAVFVFANGDIGFAGAFPSEVEDVLLV